MPKIAEKKIQVLKVGEVQYSPENSRNKYASVTLQMFTGETAGAMRVYAEKGREGIYDDILSMEKGEYIVDIEEYNGDYGLVELRYANPRLANPKQVQQPQKQ